MQKDIKERKTKKEYDKDTRQKYTNKYIDRYVRVHKNVI